MSGYNNRLGAVGEDLAVRWYRQRGYRLVDRNWRFGRHGELDVVVARAGTLVFCEVKTRSSARFGVPAAAVTPAKQHRIRVVARQWLREHDVRARRIRFDVASVMGRRVEVIEAAF